MLNSKSDELNHFDECGIFKNDLSEFKAKSLVTVFYHSFNRIAAFIHACLVGETSIVELLMDYSNKIELNAKDNNGRTALMHAHLRGHIFVLNSFSRLWKSRNKNV